MEIGYISCGVTRPCRTANIGMGTGGATTTGPDATPPPSYLSKLGGGGSVGGGFSWRVEGGFLEGRGGGGRLEDGWMDGEEAFRGLHPKDTGHEAQTEGP